MVYAEIIAIVWKFIRKYWPFVIILILIGTTLLFWSMHKNERLSHIETEKERQRWEVNALGLQNDTSEYSSQISLLRTEVNKVPYLENRIEKLSKELGIKKKDINYLHTIIANSRYGDSVLIKMDTVEVSGDPEVFYSIPIEWGCATGTAEWMYGDTKAYVSGDNKLELDIVGFREKREGYIKDNFKFFWKFKWSLIGSTKWDNRIKVIDRCDTSRTWKKNIIFDIK